MDDAHTPGRPFEEPAPLVDEALAATDRKQDDHEELDAVRAEVSHLKESARETASSAGRLIKEDLRQRVRSKPLAFASAIGILAFIYGATR